MLTSHHAPVKHAPRPVQPTLEPVRPQQTELQKPKETHKLHPALEFLRVLAILGVVFASLMGISISIGSLTGIEPSEADSTELKRDARDGVWRSRSLPEPRQILHDQP